MCLQPALYLSLWLLICEVVREGARSPSPRAGGLTARANALGNVQAQSNTQETLAPIII